jgi:hypothetical protein
MNFRNTSIRETKGWYLKQLSLELLSLDFIGVLILDSNDLLLWGGTHPDVVDDEDGRSYSLQVLFQVNLLAGIIVVTDCTDCRIKVP